MKKSMGQQLFQAAVVLLGTLVCGLGIQLELFSGAGVDPLTMFEEGLGRTTGVATGTIALGVNCVMLLLALLLNRKISGRAPSSRCSAWAPPSISLPG